MRGSSVFGVDGYFIGESPVPPPAASDAWLATPPVAYTIQKPGDGVKFINRDLDLESIKDYKGAFLRVLHGNTYLQRF